MKHQERTPDDQLQLRVRHPEFQTYLDFNERESERVTTHFESHLDLKYGPSDLQGLDIFPSKQSNSPIVVFIHGGYWRALDKSSYRFVAEPFVKNNMTVCLINYRLLPAVNMETLLSDINQALVYIQKVATRFNGDPERLVLSGHSAGGHLALMAYLQNAQLRQHIRAICSISGIFDLAPIRNSYLNEELHLDKTDVARFSITGQDLSRVKCPLLLTVGADETSFFIEESKKLYAKAESSASISYYEYPALNHYQIVHKLGEKGSALVSWVIDCCNN